jgi:N-acetylglucosaminyl-diphospho-decaprenol L-rhamnosyltransferase
MSGDPLVSIVIVSYNTREMTCACIKSVLDQGNGLYQEIIVIDNSSSDGSADAISERFPTVKLIRSSDNLGFAKGNNVAACGAHGEYLLLLNPDTLILDNAIGKLVDFAGQKPGAKMWGGKTLFGDKSLNPASCWAFMSLWSITANAIGLSVMFPKNPVFNPEAYAGWDRGTEREVDLITGCFLMMKRAFWNELNGFDEKFYIYAEEADLCYRARELGARPTVTPTAQIVHYGGASETVRAGKLIRLWSGKATFLHKHWSRSSAKLGVALFKLHALVRASLYGLSGALCGKSNHTTAAREWWELWKSRRTWENGYP